MTTPERVAELLDEDERLSGEHRAALAELFRVAYEQFANSSTNGEVAVHYRREHEFDNDGSTGLK